MKTATVRELRNSFPRIEAWIHEGETVRISKRGKVIATLVPAAAADADGQRPPKVDIMARLRETWGERVFTMEEVTAMREDELAEDIARWTSSMSRRPSNSAPGSSSPSTPIRKGSLKRKGSPSRCDA